MPQLVSIKITRKGDMADPFPGIKFQSGLAQIEKVEIAEGMMMPSGLAAINFVVKADGKYYFAEMSENIFEMIGASLRGAKEYWKENPIK